MNSHWFKAVVYNSRGHENISIHLLIPSKTPTSPQVLRQAGQKLLEILGNRFFLEFVSCTEELPSEDCSCISCKFYRKGHKSDTKKIKTASEKSKPFSTDRVRQLVLFP